MGPDVRFSGVGGGHLLHEDWWGGRRWFLGLCKTERKEYVLKESEIDTVRGGNGYNQKRRNIRCSWIVIWKGLTGMKVSQGPYNTTASRTQLHNEKRRQHRFPTCQFAYTAKSYLCQTLPRPMHCDRVDGIVVHNRSKVRPMT